MADYSAWEMMVVAPARQVRDGEVVFVGIGLPFLAANLAKRTDAPRAVLLCESGVVDGDPARLPLSVADPALVDGTASIATMKVSDQGGTQVPWHGGVRRQMEQGKAEGRRTRR